jgi:hypothetical protein
VYNTWREVEEFLAIHHVDYQDRFGNLLPTSPEFVQDS